MEKFRPNLNVSCAHGLLRNFKGAFVLTLLYLFTSCQSYRPQPLPANYRALGLPKGEITQVELRGIQILRIDEDPFITYSDQSVIVPKGTYTVVYRVYVHGKEQKWYKSTLTFERNNYLWEAKMLLSGQVLFSLQEQRWFGKNRQWDTSHPQILVTPQEQELWQQELIALGALIVETP